MIQRNIRIAACMLVSKDGVIVQLEKVFTERPVAQAREWLFDMVSGEDSWEWKVGGDDPMSPIGRIETPTNIYQYEVAETIVEVHVHVVEGQAF
jgi:hypothetical protein